MSPAPRPAPPAPTAAGQIALPRFIAIAFLSTVAHPRPRLRPIRPTPPLIIGAIICCAAGAAAVFSPTLPFLIAARFVQGATGAAGMAIGRAVIADIATGSTAARAFSSARRPASSTPDHRADPR